MSKIWPKWIVLRYFNDHDSPEIAGITIGASNATTLYQELNRLKINTSNVISLSINEEKQPKEKAEMFFDWEHKSQRRMLPMKSGKKPTRAQGKFLLANGYNPKDWLVFKNQDCEMHLVHRTDEDKTAVLMK